MGFFGSGWIGQLAQGLGRLGLQLGEAALSGSTTYPKDFLDHGFTANVYGRDWPRCRGDVRLEGLPIYATPIIAARHKRVSGGFLGIGQTTIYYNTYSISYMIGFGKKLGGGAAKQFLRIYADNKLLFNGIGSQAKITGTVTVAIVSGGQLQGSTTLKITLASGATFSAKVLDLLQFPVSDPNHTYEVQDPINVTGPGTFTVAIWPPLQTNLPGGDPVTSPGLGVSPFDLSSFDPDPHDGSHPVGFVVPPGAIRFYLGDITDQPDPLIVNNWGSGNVPGYRNLFKIMIAHLQLANYGNHPPRIEARIAVDTAAGQYPLIGPFANAAGTVLVTTGGVSWALPYSGPATGRFLNPLTSTLPFVWVQYAISAVEYIARINTQTNIIEATWPELNAWSGIVADAEGFVYQVGPSSLNHWDMYKWNGMTGDLIADYGPGNPGANQPSIGQPASLMVWEFQQSLFGNPVRIKLLAMLAAFGGINFWDGNSLTQFGTPSSSPGLPLIEYEVKKDGTGVLTPGNVTSAFSTAFGGGGTQNGGMCVDGDGNLWISQNSKLQKFNCQFQSFIDLTNPQNPFPVLLPPTFARTDYDISAFVSNGIPIFYDPADNSIVIFNVARLSVSTGLITASGGFGLVGNSSSDAVDPLGTALDAGNPTVSRYDVNFLTRTSQYNLANWLAGVNQNGTAYDYLSDTLFFSNASDGKLYRAILDRGIGGSVGLDQIVTGVHNEAAVSAFDATNLASVSVGGIRLKREAYRTSIQNLMKGYQFGACESDAEIKYILNGQSPALTISEDDLGALSELTKKDKRMSEVLTDELDVPLSYWIHYYSTIRDDQESTQFFMREAQAWATTLTAAKPSTFSREKAEITLPIYSDDSTMKLRARTLFWAMWAERYIRRFNTPGLKYVRLDPTDVVLLDYKLSLLETRLLKIDRGVTFALDFDGVSQDRFIYTAPTFTPVASPTQSGSGGGVSPPPTSSSHGNYNINPVYPLTSPNSTTIDMAAFTATFEDGLQTKYNARVFTVPNPGAGMTQIYYVTITDPTFTGDAIGMTNLTPNVQITPSAAFVGQDGYIYAGAILVAGTGATGGNPSPGGQPITGSAQLLAVLSFTSSRGPFTLAHNLGVVPQSIAITVTGPTSLPDPTVPSPPIGEVDLQTRWADATNVYLFGSADGITGYVSIWG